MADVLVGRPLAKVEMATPLGVVSADSHAGPSLADMRQYCPKDHMEAFDELEREHEKRLADAGPVAGSRSKLDVPEARILAEQSARLRNTEGGRDVHARLRDMDRDGVAAEVIFQGTQDGASLPFAGLGGFVDLTGEGLSLAYVGIQIYNRWLADACSVAPERLIGCVHLPVWDVEESLKELSWAREAGLRSVNFPAPRRGIAFYDDPVWEPFWSACEDLGMTLSTHAGAIDRSEVATPGPHELFLRMLEAGGWPARRAINRLVFGGVFERHPRLRLALTEQNHDWWPATVREFDSAYRSSGWQIRDQVPRLPSEYLRDHVMIGASFMAPFEAEAAVAGDYVANVMWGRDYPHLEGTWVYQDTDDDENMTRLSMRYAFSAIAPEHVHAMVSDNAIRFYGLDAADLQQVAERIGAPSLNELAKPIDAIPELGRGGMLAFRTIGPWG